MAPDQAPPRRVSRKLTKKRKPTRASSVQFPERLREGEDVQEDVTAANGKPTQYMNQSVFSMIAAAGSKVDFNARFDEESSESEEDQVTSKPAKHAASLEDRINPAQTDELQNEGPPKIAMGKEHDTSAGRKDYPVLPKLRMNTIGEKNYMSQSTILPSLQDSSTAEAISNGITPRDAPVMSKMLEAQAELSPSTLLPETKKGGVTVVEPSDPPRTLTKLVLRLKEIFGFEESEDVISGALIVRFFSCNYTLIKRQSIHAGFCRVCFFKDTCTLHRNISVFTHICPKNP